MTNAEKPSLKTHITISYRGQMSDEIRGLVIMLEKNGWQFDCETDQSLKSPASIHYYKEHKGE